MLRMSGMKVIGIIGVVLGLGLLSGCSTSYYAQKHGVSQQQVNQDDYACKRDSMQQGFAVYGGMAAGGSELNIELWRSCMLAKGYTVTPQ
jgi:hypothetical protein